jgi:hypothetical protein
MADNVYDITSLDPNGENPLDVEIEGIGGTLAIRPFWKSSIIRIGVVIVALRVVAVAHDIIVRRMDEKNND